MVESFDVAAPCRRTKVVSLFVAGILIELAKRCILTFVLFLVFNTFTGKLRKADPQMYLGLQPARELSSLSMSLPSSELSSIEGVVEETSKQKSKTSTSSSKSGKAAGSKCPTGATSACTNTPPVQGTLIEVGSITTGTTVGGLGPGEISFPFCGTSFTSPSIFYRVVGTGANMTASTCNDGNAATGSADYDSKISVFTSCGFQCVAGNDDGAGCSGFSSLVSWQSACGLEYTIIVHGFGGATGNFELSVSEQ